MLSETTPMTQSYPLPNSPEAFPRNPDIYMLLRSMAANQQVMCYYYFVRIIISIGLVFAFLRERFVPPNG